MKLYKHLGNGHYIGSVCIVYAETKEEAEKIIRKRLDESGLKKECLEVEHIQEWPGGIIYFQNGDY